MPSCPVRKTHYFAAVGDRQRDRKGEPGVALVLADIRFGLLGGGARSLRARRPDGLTWSASAAASVEGQRTGEPEGGAMKAIVQHEYGAPQDVLHLAEWRCRPSVRRTCWCRCVYGFGHGAFAEYVAVPQGSLAPKPGNLSFEQAAAVPLAAVTALQGLRAGGLQPGQQILIAGASGGVGTFAVQIAGHVIDYTKHDFTLGAARYDLVLQLGGTYSPAAVRKVLTPDGTLIQFSSDGSRWF